MNEALRVLEQLNQKAVKLSGSQDYTTVKRQIDDQFCAFSKFTKLGLF